MVIFLDPGLIAIRVVKLVFLVFVPDKKDVESLKRWLGWGYLWF